MPPKGAMATCSQGRTAGPRLCCLWESSPGRPVAVAGARLFSGQRPGCAPSHSGMDSGCGQAGRHQDWVQGAAVCRLTVGIILLAERLRGGLAMAVLLAPVVLFLAQVLLG